MALNSLLIRSNNCMYIVYYGRVIAAVDEQGGLIWNDDIYPVYLIDYLIEFLATSENARNN